MFVTFTKGQEKKDQYVIKVNCFLKNINQFLQCVSSILIN